MGETVADLCVSSRGRTRMETSEAKSDARVELRVPQCGTEMQLESKELSLWGRRS